MNSVSNKKSLPLGWGTGAVFGHACNISEANKLIHLLLDNGINFFDTGPSYARGKSQRLLASCLKSNCVKRDDILISTKVGSVPSQIPFGKTKKNFKKSSFEKLVDQSLNEFNTDYLDILFLHGLPNEELNEDSYYYFNYLKSQGKVRFLGVSAHSKKDLQWTINNSSNIDCVMCHYNLLNHIEVEPFLTTLKEKSIKVIGSSPFAGGLLSNKKKFNNLKTLKSDLFYSLKDFLPRQRIRSKNANKIIKEIINKNNSENYPLEFSLNASCVDITIFGSLSKNSILNSINLLDQMNLLNK